MNEEVYLPLQQIASFIPNRILHQIISNTLPSPGTPIPLTAAVLFCDISGFTPMTEDLASDGPRGAEELNRILLSIFTPMIDLIHEAGGTIAHFYGDAMNVYFPETETKNGAQICHQAFATATGMQILMAHSLSTVTANRPANKPNQFSLTMKIGLAFGPCTELIVGDSETTFELILAGAPVDAAAIAEHHASATEIWADQSFAAQLNINSDAPFLQLEKTSPIIPTAPLFDWDILSNEQTNHLQQTIRKFLPLPLYQRLIETSTQFIAEHRPATSIFVQFTGLDDTHPEFGALIQQYYLWAAKIIHHYAPTNGRVNRILTGDKGYILHIIFGAPVAPDAPDQAVRAAIALQKEKPPFILSQKIGIAVGKQFACPVGSPGRREYTVVGDVVNLSARLCQICPPDQILISQETAQRTQQQFELTPLPPQQIKGKKLPIQTFTVTGTKSHPKPNQYVPLIGRENELSLLTESIQKSLHHGGHILLITGSTGVGKTTFLQEAIHRWQTNPNFIGYCQQHTTELAYSGWQDIWPDFFDLNPADPLPTQIKQILHQSKQLWPEGGEDYFLWGDMLTIPMPPIPLLEQMAATARQARLFNLARHCLLNQGTKQPLLFIIEDIQWADQATIDFLTYLRPYLDTHPILILLTGDEESPQLYPDLADQHLKLGNLSTENGRLLLRHLLGESQIPTILEQHLGLIDQYGRTSEINPMFLKEAVEMLFDQQILKRNGRLILHEEKLTNSPIPDTIHGLLLAHFDRLPPSQRTTLQIAATIGRQFSYNALNQLTPEQARTTIQKDLTNLIAEEILDFLPQEQDLDLSYLFRHALSREVVYESLPFAQRQILHARAAYHLLATHEENPKSIYPIVAYHYSYTNEHKKGVKYALLAASEAQEISANQEAIRLYIMAEKHIAFLPSEQYIPQQMTLYLNRALVYLILGQFEHAAKDAWQAYELAQPLNDIPSMVQSYNILADLNYRQNHLDDAQSLTQHILTHWRDEASSDELIRTYLWAGMIDSRLGQFQQAFTYLQQAEKLASQLNNNGRLARTYEAIAFLHYAQQQLPLALEAMQKSVSLSRDFSAPHNLCSALCNIGLIQFTLGQPQLASNTLAEAVALAQDSSRYLFAFILSNQAEVFAYLGEMDQAFACFTQSTQLLEQIQDIPQLAKSYILWGYEYYLPLNEIDAANDLFVKASNLLANHAGDFSELQLQLYLAQTTLALKIELTSTADMLLKHAQPLLHNQPWWETLYYYLKGCFYKETSDLDNAHSSFQQAINSAKQQGNPDYLSLTLLELAALSPNITTKIDYLTQMLEALTQRARATDRQQSINNALTLLEKEPDPNQYPLYQQLLNLNTRL